MNIDDIVRSINGDNAETVKEAAAISTRGALENVLSKIETNAHVEKKAAASDDSVEALMKIASELAGAEKEAEAAQAYICGNAFADGAIAKFAAYDAAVKEAAAQDAITLLREERQKVASTSDVNAIYAQARADVEHELLLKQAADAGYQQAKAILTQKTAAPLGYSAMRKAAEEAVCDAKKEEEKKEEKKDGFKPEEKKEEEGKEVMAGYNAALQQIHDTATREFLKGAAVAEVMVAKYRAAR